MRTLPRRCCAAVTLLTTGCVNANVRAGSPPLQLPTTTARTRPPAGKALSSDRHALALEFVRWFEFRYVKDMQRVGGMSTDVADTVRRIGTTKTVARYVANRRAELDYAMAHPTPNEIPRADLDRITRAKYDGVIANVTTSGKWIDYRKKEVVSGIKRAYEQMARTWIAFYRRLLSAPGSGAAGDFRALIRRALTREEYTKTVEANLAGKQAFYASLKKGVAWYAPWAPLIKGSLDSALAKERTLWLATVSEIYGPAPADGP